MKKGQVLYRLKQDTFQTALDGAKAKLGTVRDQMLTLQASYKLSLAQIEQAQADISLLSDRVQAPEGSAGEGLRNQGQFRRGPARPRCRRPEDVRSPRRKPQRRSPSSAAIPISRWKGTPAICRRNPTSTTPSASSMTRP